MLATRPARAHLIAIACSCSLAGVAACKSQSPPEPVASDPTPAVTGSAAQASASVGRRPLLARDRQARRQTITPRPAASVPISEDDPLKGKWTLVEATKDIPGKGSLLATIDTDMGAISCVLFEDKSPITTAAFVGLATGKRTWKNPDGKWVNKPAYDGTIFHRIIKGFMIQGGDAAGTGAGEPGFLIPDEIWADAYHDRPGQLCVANRGPNTNGAQFFITDAAAAHLDNRYTIFGECGPVDLVHKIAAVEVKGEKPLTPPKIKKVTIKRGPSPIASSSASSTPPPAAPAD